MDELPEFERPPLAEVALGVQFDPLVGMSTAHLGAIWARFRREFPRTEDREPIATSFERFDSPRERQSLRWNLDLLTRPPLPRCWFVNEIGDEVLQLQQDRFLHNWRKVDAQPAYPRYSRLRKKFEAEFAALQRFASVEGIGVIEPNQCEVTYINHVVAGKTWSEHREAGKVFRTLVDSTAVSQTSGPEHIRFDTAFVIQAGGGEPRGRLHVSIVSGFLKENARPMFAMTLTARGAPLGRGLAGVLAFLDLGHRSIVRGFTELTTESMHAAWGKRTR